MHEPLQHLGIISIVLMWTAIGVLLKRHAPTKHKAVSSHAAQKKTYALWFAVVEAPLTILFGVFMFGWFIPAYDLGFWFSVFTGFVVGGLFGASVVPQATGWRYATHQVFAFTLAIGMLLTNAYFLLDTDTASFGRLLALVGLVYMSAVWALGFSKSRVLSEHFLYFQLAYFISYDIPLLTITYFG